MTPEREKELREFDHGTDGCGCSLIIDELFAEIDSLRVIVFADDFGVPTCLQHMYRDQCKQLKGMREKLAVAVRYLKHISLDRMQKEVPLQYSEDEYDRRLAKEALSTIRSTSFRENL